MRCSVQTVQRTCWREWLLVTGLPHLLGRTVRSTAHQYAARQHCTVRCAHYTPPHHYCTSTDGIKRVMQATRRKWMNSLKFASKKSWKFLIFPSTEFFSGWEGKIGDAIVGLQLFGVQWQGDSHECHDLITRLLLSLKPRKAAAHQVSCAAAVGYKYSYLAFYCLNPWFVQILKHVLHFSNSGSTLQLHHWMNGADSQHRAATIFSETFQTKNHRKNSFSFPTKFN